MLDVSITSLVADPIGTRPMIEAIATEQAPQAIGPYSQAVRAGQFLFVSGQIAIDPATGALAPGDVAAQTHQVMRNLGGILRKAGVSYDAVVRTTVYLLDLTDFGTVNEVYGSYFGQPAPARATVQVSRMPKDGRLEIDAIAFLG